MNSINKRKEMRNTRLDKLTREMDEISRQAEKATGKEKENLVNKWYLKIKEVNFEYRKPQSCMQKLHS